MADEQAEAEVRTLDLANGSFELPAINGEAGATSNRAEGWQLRNAEVVRADSAEGQALERLDGGQFAAFDGYRDAALSHRTEHAFEPWTLYRFTAHVADHKESALTPGASMALKLQNVDAESGKALANLAVRTLIVGREPLSQDGLTPYEVEFATGEVPPPGLIQVTLEVVTPAGDKVGRWIVDKVGLTASAVASGEPRVAAAVDPDLTYSYNFHVRPILSNNCFACHGPDPEDRAAGLRLDTREGALEHGVIVPGDAAGSEVMARITSADPREVMPPPEAHSTLSSEEIEVIRGWIDEGAHYEQHWAYVPVTRPEPPQVDDNGWVRNLIDKFVLARLQEEGLKPNEEADRRTLARRVSFDLIGLPPAPEWVEEFVNDTREDAYERLVDRLMESVHWGEHRARYWLDIARYADTHGIHFDNYREIWGYRDWVINAFNRNLPFDQFSLEQLAGDLLPEPTDDQLIATGFNRANMTTNEGGIIDEEYKVIYAVDRTDTFGAAWLGLTASCAACHDHKYDPFPATDFYSLAAFFDNNAVPVRDGNRKDPAPLLKIRSDEDRERFEQLEQEIPAASEALAAFDKSVADDFDQWLGTVDAAALDAAVPSEGLVFAAALDGTGVEANGENLPFTRVEGPFGTDSAALLVNQPGEILPDTPDVDSGDKFSFGLWVRVQDASQVGALVARMDVGRNHRGFDLWLQQGKLAAHIIDAWPDNAIKVVSEGELKNNQWHHVFLTWDGSSKAEGLKLYLDGERQAAAPTNDRLSGSIVTDQPLRLGRRSNANPLLGLTVADFKWFDRELDPEEVGSLATGHQLRSLLAGDRESLDDEQREQLLQAFLLLEKSGERDGYASALAALEREREEIDERSPVTLIFKEADTLPTAFVLHRGEYDARRDLVPADTPGALPPMSGDLPRNRLGLAHWLFTEENPLTARVTVNRFWAELFGTGLVETAGDFGLAGMLPSHPELLDWLAVEFRDGGWDVKEFYRLLVTSATYRQAAHVSPEKLEKDPDNLLFSRGPRFRMDAEMVRDNALAASGILVPKIGGPSVRPYQPEGVWEAVAMPGSNTRNYRQDSGDALYRRSMYTFWKRAAPPASLDVFNAPNREFCTPARERTNTPLQALVTLNDPQFVEAARFLASRVLLETGEDCDRRRSDFAALRILARPLRDEEFEILSGSLTAMREHYAAHPGDAQALIGVGASTPPEELADRKPELAAWTVICSELMNLDETINK